MSAPGESYPRPLTPMENNLVLWVLPEGSEGYAPYREFVGRASVIGQGRRGEGEIILGRPGDRPDLDSPLPPVVSHGVAAADGDEISVTVREIVEGQMSVEIVGRRNDRVPPGALIDKRWTYARWQPGLPCPQCGRPAREVEIARAGADARPAVLATCAADRRIWIYGGKTSVCRPVPVTNYYNELMLLKKIRDPDTALVSARLFDHLDGYSSADLASAFVAYNRVRTKIELPGTAAGAPGQGRGVVRRFLSLFSRS